MKKLLLLFLFAPLMYAEDVRDNQQVCIIQAGVSSTVDNLIKCNKGDVLFIKGRGFDEDVELASRVCEIDTIKFAGGKASNNVGRTVCIYTGYLRTIRVNSDK